MALPLISWTDEYAIGHTGLDAEHHQLVDAINEISSIKYAEYKLDQLRPLLEALTIATVNHFKHENTLMRELCFWASQLPADRRTTLNTMSTAAMNEHCAEHAQALLRLESIIHAFYFGEKSGGETLGKTLMDWFTEHALEHDVDLREVLRVYFTETNGGGGKH